MTYQMGHNDSASGDVMAELSVRLVVADHCMSRPVPGIDVVYSDFRGADIKQVPVLRIFGPTTDGHKACVHIHGVFPYFYIPCGVSNPEPQLLYQIAASLDKALNISLKQANSTNQHVYRITLVKGLPFYGFHDTDHLFFKVFLYNPSLIKQAVELFNNGAVMGLAFQPHEAHLNFTLQFFIDFNIFGMSNVNLQSVRFRKKGTSESHITRSSDVFADSANTVKPESACYYEADALACHIINRQRIGRRDGIENPGLEEVWNQENERRRQLNMSLATKSLTQQRDNNERESHHRFERMFWIKISNLIEKPVETSSLVNESTYYPAESLEGSQLMNASDVSMHQPCDSPLNQSSGSFTKSLEDTIVDESVAFNCSLAEHYSQILDSEDMNFIDLLRDMEQPVDEDSVLGTQAHVCEGAEDSDDAEYSKIFSDTTLLGDGFNALVNEDQEEQASMEIEVGDNQVNWHDSFWEGVNIPQLDGACDDEHTKKVRKRRNHRTRSLGLPHPKQKNALDVPRLQEVQSILGPNNLYNTGNSSSNIYSANNIDSKNSISISDIKLQLFNENSHERVTENGSNKILTSKGKELDSPLKIKKMDQCFLYDIERKYEPVAGPSSFDFVEDDGKINGSVDCSSVDCSVVSDSTSDQGIISFYDMSKIFNVENDMSVCITDIEGNNLIPNVKLENEYFNSLPNASTNIRLLTSTSTIKTVSSEQKPTVSEEVLRGSKVILAPHFRPPTRKDIESSLHLYSIPAIKHLKPYYSNYKDAGNKIEVGQIVLKLSSRAAHHQKPFDVKNVTSIDEWRKYLFMENSQLREDKIALKSLLSGSRKCLLEPVKMPPSVKEVNEWLEFNLTKEREMTRLAPEEVTKAVDELGNTQVIGLATEEANNTFILVNDDIEMIKPNLDMSLHVSMQPDGSFLCYGDSANQNETHSVDASPVEHNFLTLMTIEVHADVRGDLNPDPQFDAITAVFISVNNDSPPGHFLPRSVTQVYVVDKNSSYLNRCGIPSSVMYVFDETLLIGKVVESVRQWDPDILSAYEIELNSWGYILERSEALGLDSVLEISRITEKNKQRKWRSEDNSYEGRILGRVVFNVWRMLRHELPLSSYSFENTMYHVLRERVPRYTPAQLATWWKSESRQHRWICVDYYLTRLSGTIRILEKLDMINRTSELARLFGMQWWEVLSRGSQFRVESLMLRAARPLNLIALSPSVRQRAAMRAPECLPLIFEPESRFYSDPVIVLDFQSLYPSMMIAYNYCFSTCIGRVHNISGDDAYEFGAWRLRIPKSKLETLAKKELIHWSPVGVGFVTPAVRRGVLPALLRRILAARQAVKKTMKVQTDEAVKKALHSRQLGLKLIANVTYGYTAASFSGRMPCTEVGDSVVAKGRETLERAVQLVENCGRWNVKVVYGDTDSMFVLVPGGTRQQAFVIGQQIADAVTADNPSPVALKLEKIYQPCILQTKKRYVGYMYETADQETPVYDAKGIETVRRDGCPAGVKLLRRSLCELFTFGDVSRVKSIVMSTLSRLTDGLMPMHELLFTREYNGPRGYRPGAVAPPLEIARRLGSHDRRRVPRTGERVSWAVCAGAPGLPLVRLARTPDEILADPALRPHVAYYVSRILLPPLHRCLALIGADVFMWYRTMALRPDSGVGGIVQYMWKSRCVACGERAPRAICRPCSVRPEWTVPTIVQKLNCEASHVCNAELICRSCCGHRSTQCCNNTECPVLWRKRSAELRLRQTKEIVQTLPPYLHCAELDF